jgi:hypothetical protein
MTAQSWVETTLPPGYRVGPGYSGREWAFNVFGSHLSQWYASREDACRAAWQHWTASILRGRDVLWRVTPEVLEASITTGDHYVFIDLCAGEFRTGVHDYIVGDCYGAITDDVDEAMARLASLVLASGVLSLTHPQV